MYYIQPRALQIKKRNVNLKILFCKQATFSAAMKGELGPLAQAVAKYQSERKLHIEVDKLKAIEKNLKKMQAMNKPKEPNVSNKLFILNILVIKNFNK